MESDEFVLLDHMRRFRQLQIQLMGKLYTLSHSEIAVLQEIQHAGGYANVTDMSRALVVSPPAISRTLRQLREKRLVDSRPDENDRRGTYVVMTPQGKEMLQRDMAQRQRFFSAVTQRMGPEQWKQMSELMEQLYESMRLELEQWPADEPERKE